MLGPCHESSVLILTAMLGGRWLCDSYFTDEKTGIKRLIDLLKVTHPVSDGVQCPTLAVWLHRWDSDHKAILTIVERAVHRRTHRCLFLFTGKAPGEPHSRIPPGSGARTRSGRVRSCSEASAPATLGPGLSHLPFTSLPWRMMCWLVAWWFFSWSLTNKLWSL